MMNNDNVAPGDKAMILLQSLICYLAQSARSCDFGQVEERTLNA
ncbi:hypothetical protein [Sphingobium baderi]|uniref:Uncharacterized protein n=1 Tax=Sphingobium baderi LL03 TaxID=1114964 RepID=T0GLV2_9SPHN|nr:hypothetical protein [Sphingobium baderi]EQB00998.1 hypothetical protein L485_11850 [Sphingobium baderi LL03]KMS51059.1 hypothetical protein V475_22845 [Sphingobium baderi LL03]